MNIVTRRWLTHLTFAVAVFLSRLGILPPNYSPLGSFGFFSGNAILYFGIIVMFDYFVGGFYDGVVFTYLGFSAYYILGRLAGKDFKKQALFVLLASISFFLLSNFGVWLAWYPRTMAGLIECYTLALPFFKNTYFGDIAFGYACILWQLIPFQKLSSIHQRMNLPIHT